MGIEIDLERDSLLGEVSRKRLRESYMKEEEQSPQERFATVAETFASNPAHAQRIYDYASKHWLSFSTPILSFGRRSCQYIIRSQLAFHAGRRGWHPCRY